MCKRPKTPNYKPLAEAQRYAADLQFKATQDAIAAWKAHQEQTRADFAPYRDRGLEAMKQLRDGWDSGKWAGEQFSGELDLPDFSYEGEIPEFDPSSFDVREDPSYDFRMSEGLKAVRRAAAAGSGARGGATMKALTRFGQDYASTEYGKAYDRAVGRYRLARENESMRYGRAVQAYGLNRQNLIDEHQASLQAWQADQTWRQRMYGNVMGEVGMGLNAAAQTGNFNAQAVGQQSQLAFQGASAIGAGAVGGANAMIAQQQAAAAAGQQGFNNFMNVVGLGAGLAVGLSDRRVKRDIQRIGTAPNGLPWYRFRYVGDTKWSYGFMADEVEKADPKAVIIEHGTKHVDYDRAFAAPARPVRPPTVRPPARRVA